MTNREGLVWMATPKQGNRLQAGVLWAADNGAFTAKGREGFTVDGYLDWLRSKAWAASDCLFATAPDVVADAVATLALSAPVLPLIREAGYKAALVAQDGLESLEVPWDSFDVLFIGGSTEWKLGPEARALTAEAKRRGKWVHMGRVNSYQRLRYAAHIGCDSTDGTFIAFAPDENLLAVKAWLRGLAAQPSLFGGAA